MRGNFPIIILLLFNFNCYNKKSEPVSIDYMGQTPPKEIPAIFAPGIVSITDRFDIGSSFSPDGKLFVFGVASETDPTETCLYLMVNDHDHWSKPSKTFLPGNIKTAFPMFSADGRYFFHSVTAENGENDIWQSEVSDNRIINSKRLPGVINSKFREAGHGLTLDHTLYFTSNRDQEHACCGDIYVSKLEQSNYRSVKKVEGINTDEDEESLYISPDEDYMIIQAWKDKYQSMHDLYISYHKTDQSWTTPKRLNKLINSPMIEQRPFISPDSKYLFFNRMSINQVNGVDHYESDLYWVSVQSIFAPFVNQPANDITTTVGKTCSFKLAEDAFMDIDQHKLTITAKLKDGNELPSWLTFNPLQSSFKGSPNHAEIVNIEITAIDSYGNKVSDDFLLTVAND